MKLLNFFRKTSHEDNVSRFSGFFLHATEKRKEEILREVARKANEDQKRVFTNSRFKEKVS